MAKIKKQAWKSMGGAFNSIKSSVDPMKSFGKIMEVLSVVMLPLTFLFTLLAGVIAARLMPYIAALITTIDELGISADSTAWYMRGALDILLIYWPVWWKAKLDELAIYESLAIAAGDWSEAIIVLVGDIFIAFKDMIDDVIEYITFGLVGGDDGGGSPCDDPLYYATHILECTGQAIVSGSSSSSSTSSTANTVNINLTGAIVDNKAQLINDIVEQVIIRIG